MKLFFEENLSPKLVQALADISPDSAHVDRFSLGGSADNDVWEYTKEHGFTLVSKDSDCYDKSMLHGHSKVGRGRYLIRQIQWLLRNLVESIRAIYKDDQISTFGIA